MIFLELFCVCIFKYFNDDAILITDIFIIFLLISSFLTEALLSNALSKILL